VAVILAAIYREAGGPGIGPEAWGDREAWESFAQLFVNPSLPIGRLFAPSSLRKPLNPNHVHQPVTFLRWDTKTCVVDIQGSTIRQSRRQVSRSRMSLIGPGRDIGNGELQLALVKGLGHGVGAHGYFAQGVC